MIQTKLYKNLRILLRIALPALVLYVVFDRMKSDWLLFNGMEIGSITAGFGWVLVALILMLVNWGMETLKWRRMIVHLQPMEYSSALQSVLLGTALNLFIPNRIGELGGRLLHIHQGNRKRALLINMFNAACQLVATIIFGIIAVFALRNEFTHVFKSTGWPDTSYMATILSTLFFMAIIFTKPILRRAKRNKWVRGRMETVKNTITLIGGEWFICFLLSIFRYVVFSVQYYLLLRYFMVDVPVITCFSVIWAVFFINTAIPGGALMELGVRSSAALILFGMFSPNVTGILAATLLLWVINLALPALIGLFFVRKINLLPIRTT